MLHSVYITIMVVSLFTGMSYMLATNNILELGVLYLTQLSTTVQFYQGCRFYWWRKPQTCLKWLTIMVT